MPVVDGFTATSGASTAFSATLAVTVPRAVAAGSSILLTASRGDNGSQAVGLASITDSRSNTWVLGDARALRGSVAEVSLSHAHLTTGLQVGDTITVTWNSTSARRNVVVQVATGLQSVAAEATTGTTLTAGTNSGPNGLSSTPTATTGATTTAQCLVVAAVAVGNTAGLPMTAGAGYTLGATASTTTATADRGVQTEYRTTSAAGAQTAPATLSTSSTWAEVVAAYPLASSIPTVNAGADQVKYGGELATLSAAVTGTTTGGSWSQVSGTTATLTTINATTSTFTAEVGNVADVVRVFRYTATYTGGTVVDDVTVTVPGAAVLTALAGVYVAAQVLSA